MAVNESKPERGTYVCVFSALYPWLFDPHYGSVAGHDSYPFAL